MTNNEKLKVPGSVNFLFDYFEKQLEVTADSPLRKTKA